MRNLFTKRTTLLRDLLLETDEENFVGYRSENNFVGHQNNFVGILKIILQKLTDLSVLHYYFDSFSKLFF